MRTILFSSTTAPDTVGGRAGQQIERASAGQGAAAGNEDDPEVRGPHAALAVKLQVVSSGPDLPMSQEVGTTPFLPFPETRFAYDRIMAICKGLQIASVRVAVRVWSKIFCWSLLLTVVGGKMYGIWSFLHSSKRPPPAQARDPGRTFVLGERLSYVLLAGARLQDEAAEDPLTAALAHAPPDLELCAAPWLVRSYKFNMMQDN